MRLRRQNEGSDLDISENMGVRQGFTIWLTVFNILLTSLTITTVSLYHGSRNSYVDTDCKCGFESNSIDPRYKNPNMNPDLKRVSG
jgi:hypothetical protein